MTARKMVEIIGYPAAYGMLAEEAAELSAAASKMERVLRGENPTPISPTVAFENIVEEYGDVLNCLDGLGIKPNPELMHRKLTRFESRMNRI